MSAASISSGTDLPISILADIEGSSGCVDRSSAQFATDSWSQACLGMTRDVQCVIQRLLNEGYKRIIVQDFHRTGFNLYPEGIDQRAILLQGYRPGIFPGMGTPPRRGALCLLGMHAASGTDGFLAHTLTSRISRLRLAGEPLSESELFGRSLQELGLTPIFVSGGEQACQQAQRALPSIATFSRPWPPQPEPYWEEWREQHAEAVGTAIQTFQKRGVALALPPRKRLSIQCTFRTEQEAQRVATHWNLRRQGSTVEIEATSYLEAYQTLVKCAYLTPLLEKVLPLALRLYRIIGRTGLQWARSRLRSYPS